jgi:hypothetical protein
MPEALIVEFTGVSEAPCGAVNQARICRPGSCPVPDFSGHSCPACPPVPI